MKSDHWMKDVLEGWTSSHNDKKPYAVHYTRGGPWFDEWQDVEFASE